MAEKAATKKGTRRTTGAKKATGGFSEDEKAAMKERAKELKAAARRGKGAGKEAGEADVLAAIAAMEQPDRAMAERLHAIVMATAPDLWPRTWYGMPAYAKDDKVVCFFQGAQKFKVRYATFSFNDAAQLDEGTMWPVSYALKELGAAEEKRIVEMVRRAVG